MSLSQQHTNNNTINYGAHFYSPVRTQATPPNVDISSEVSFPRPVRIPGFRVGDCAAHRVIPQFPEESWCAWQDLILHGLLQYHLKIACAVIDDETVDRPATDERCIARDNQSTGKGVRAARRYSTAPDALFPAMNGAALLT